VNPVNFCYWLQGARELCGLDAPSDEQIGLIRNHIELVPPTSAHSVTIFNFIEGLRGALRFGVPDWAMVWQELANVFEHVIDKMSSGDHSVLNQVHGSMPRC
jgi:hypothetical protein